MPSDVTVTIRAVDAASKTISGVATQLAGLAKAKAAFDKDAAKAAAETQKLETLRSKTLTENERRLTMFNQSQAKVATENQRRLTEEQRTLTANNKMQLDAYNNIIKVVGSAAKADAQVSKIQAQTAGKNIKNAQAQEGAVKKLAQEHERAGKKAQQSQKNTQKAFLQTTPFIQKQIDAIKAMGEQIVVAGAILGGFSAIIKKAYDFGKEGAQIQRLMDTGEALANSFGVNLTEAVRKIKAASLDTITTQQAVLQVNRSLLLGIASDADTMADLMRIAAFRGRAFGLDTTEAFDRITLGIGRLSTRILDDIGIVITGEIAYAKYAAAIGKTGDKLTEAEKRQAITNAIIEEGNRLLAETGGLTEDLATKITQLETNTKDYSNTLKQFLAEPVADVAIGLDALAFGPLKVAQAFFEHKKAIELSTMSYQEYIAEMNRVTLGLPNLISAISRFKSVLDVTNPSLASFIDRLAALVNRIAATSPFLMALAKLFNIMNEEERQAARDAEALARALQEQAVIIARAKANLETYAKALELLIDIGKGLSIDFNFESAAQQVGRYNEAIGASSDFMRAFGIQLGLVDVAVLKFQESLKKAAEVTSEGGRQITADEFLKAFLPIGTAQYNAKIRELTDQLKEDLAEVQRRAAEQIADVQADFGRRELDDQIDLDRDLADLRDDNNDKEANAEKKHRRKMVDIEEDYQRAVSKIMRKFELSRIKALIDLDARALFEAEQQRDDDLKDAAESRDDKKKDEEEDYKDRIEELKKFEDDRREEILRAYERRRQDALRDLARRISDIKADEAQRRAMLEADFVTQKNKTKAELDKIIKSFQTHYNERAKDMLNFFQTNQNILESLKRGALDPTDILNQFNQVNGIPFGGLPFTPIEPNQPPPPVVHDCPEGKIWDPDAGHCVWEDEFGLAGGGGGGNTLTGDRKVRGTLTLNVAGEGMFAQMLRSSIASQFIEIISD